METRNYIHVTETVRKQLRQEFDASKVTVWRALSFTGNTSTSVKIRERAYELGGILMTVGESAKTLYDVHGRMTQYFPNGAIILCNLENSTVAILKDGDTVEKFHDVYMSQLPAIQAKAMAL